MSQLRHKLLRSIERNLFQKKAMSNLALSRKIKTLRKQKGCSQEGLAHLAELSLRTIQRIERGETEPHGYTLKRLATALGITPAELVESVEYEDRGFVTFLNLSALSFLVFPLLGVIVPLVFWILSRGKVKNNDTIGKELLNFQLTWCLVIFSWYMFVVALLFFHIKLPYLGHMSAAFGVTEFTLVSIPIVSYGYNFILTIVNTTRCYRQKKVCYRPALRFLK